MSNSIKFSILITLIAFIWLGLYLLTWKSSDMKVVPQERIIEFKRKLAEEPKRVDLREFKDGKG